MILSCFENSFQIISSLVSIDIGLSNAAFVHVDRSKRVLDWKRISVPVQRPYSPVDCKKSVSNSTCLTLIHLRLLITLLTKFHCAEMTMNLKCEAVFQVL